MPLAPFRPPFCGQNGSVDGVHGLGESTASWYERYREGDQESIPAGRMVWSIRQAPLRDRMIEFWMQEIYEFDSKKTRRRKGRLSEQTLLLGVLASSRRCQENRNYYR